MFVIAGAFVLLVSSTHFFMVMMMSRLEIMLIYVCLFENTFLFLEADFLVADIGQYFHCVYRCIEQVKNSQYLELSHDLEIDKAIMFLKLKDFQQVCTDGNMWFRICPCKHSRDISTCIVQSATRPSCFSNRISEAGLHE